MKSQINLNSTEWCDMIFEGKNKQYGAYKLRQSSSKRHVAAFIVMLVFAGVASALPRVISAVKDFTQNQNGPMEDTFELSNIPIDKQIQEENIIKQETAPPPPPLKPTIQFVPPTIAKDEEVSDEDMMKSQSEIQETKIQISVVDVKGTDKNGIDITDLNKHKVIVEEKPVKEEPFINVEQMPSFPGGELEMLRYIAENIKYPVVAQESGIQGRVTIRFVVTETGAISDITLIRGIDPSCDKEAIRVIKSMPKWIPGKQNGVNVPVYFTLPVVFRLKI